MTKKIILLISAVALSGCAKSDPTLAPGVYREGDGVYIVNLAGYRQSSASAVRQCQLDGNKKLNILSNTSERDEFEERTYAKIIFRCGDKKI